MVLYLSLRCEKNENKQKVAGIGPFYKYCNIKKEGQEWPIEWLQPFPREGISNFSQIYLFDSYCVRSTTVSAEANLDQSHKKFQSRLNTLL